MTISSTACNTNHSSRPYFCKLNAYIFAVNALCKSNFFIIVRRRALCQKYSMCFIAYRYVLKYLLLFFFGSQQRTTIDDLVTHHSCTANGQFVFGLWWEGSQRVWLQCQLDNPGHQTNTNPNHSQPEQNQNRNLTKMLLVFVLYNRKINAIGVSRVICVCALCTLYFM